MHWQSDELSVALIKGAGHYGNHEDVLFRSSRVARKSFRLPTCVRKHWKNFVSFLCPNWPTRPLDRLFKIYMATCIVAPLPFIIAAIKVETICVHGTWATIRRELIRIDPKRSVDQRAAFPPLPSGTCVRRAARTPLRRRRGANAPPLDHGAHGRHPTPCCHARGWRVCTACRTCRHECWRRGERTPPSVVACLVSGAPASAARAAGVAGATDLGWRGRIAAWCCFYARSVSAKRSSGSGDGDDWGGVGDPWGGAGFVAAAGPTSGYGVVL